MSNVHALEIAAVSTSQRSWREDTFWVSLSNLAQAGGPFLGLLMLVRWHGLEAAGQFSFAQAVTAPLAQLLNFQLKALILTYSEQELPLHLASCVRALSSIPMLLICGGLAAVFSPLLGLWMFARMVDSWAEVFQAQKQRAQQMAQAAFSVILRAFLLILCLSAGSDLATSVLYYIGLSMMVLLFLDWRFTPLRLGFHRSAMIPVFKRGSILGVVLFLQAASSSFPRILLERSTDAATLGLFATLSVVLQAGNLLASAFGQGLLPSFAGASVRRIALWSAIPFGVALMAFVLLPITEPLLLSVLQIPSAASQHGLLVCLGLAQLLIWPSAMIGYSLTARRLYRELMWVAGGLVACSAITSLLLVPSLGSIGAAISLACTAGATLAHSYYFLIRNEAAG